MHLDENFLKRTYASNNEGLSLFRATALKRVAKSVVLITFANLIGLNEKERQ